MKKPWFSNHRFLLKKITNHQNFFFAFNFHRLASHEMRSYKWKERKICHFISALYLFKYVKSSYRIWNIRRHLLTHSLAATLLCLYSYTFHTQKKALISLLFFEDCLYLAMGGRREFFFEEWDIFLYFSIHSKTAMSHCVFVSTHIRYHEILSFFFLFISIK